MPIFAPQRPFERKIYFSLVLLLLAALPFLIGNFLSWRKIVAGQRELITLHAQSLLDVESLRLASKLPAQLSALYILSGDSRILAEQEKANADFEERLNSITASDLDGHERELITQVRGFYEEQKEISAHGNALRMSGAKASEVQNFFRKYVLSREAAGRNALSQLSAHRENKFEAAKSELSLSTDRVMILLGFTSALSLVFSALVIVLLVKFVNEKKELDEQREELLRRAKKISGVRKETLETVSHDLKTPLTALRLRIQMLLRNGAGTHAEQALRSVDSMEKLIRDLLDQSKLEIGKRGLNLERSNLESPIKEVAAQLAPLAQKKSIRFESSIEELPDIQCDPPRIQQAITNLLSNAIKFTPEGGEVSLRAYSEAGELVVTVKDNGPGIPEEKIPLLFRKYWQDSATAAKGHGLGLSIASGFAQAHGGRVTVRSEVGAGSEFSLRIPLTNKVAKTFPESRPSPRGRQVFRGSITPDPS